MQQRRPRTARGCRNVDEAAHVVFGPQKWCDNHHVGSSKDNDSLPRLKRSYFDGLPAKVHRRCGEFEDLQILQPNEVQHLFEGSQVLARSANRRPSSALRRCAYRPVFPEGSPPPAWVAQDALPDTLYPEPTCDAVVSAQERSPPPSPRSKALPPKETRAAFCNGALLPDSWQVVPDREPRVATVSSGPVDGRPLDHTFIKTESSDAWSVVSPTSTCAGRGSEPEAAKVMTGTPSLGTPRAAWGRSWSTGISASQLALAELPGQEEFKNFFHWCSEKRYKLVWLWHKLDKNNNMSLHKVEFHSGMRELVYKGDITKLWDMFDRDHTQTISFFEFAPEHALELACFKFWAEQKYGSVQGIFQSLDANRDGKVTPAEFRKGCLDSGLPDLLVPALSTLFLMLDCEDHCVGALTRSELDYLDKWECPAFMWELPNFAAKDALKKAVVRRHQKFSLVAWRRDLDKDGSMRVNYGEFVSYCRTLERLRVPEAKPQCGITAVFCAFDQERTGWFSLKEWDPDGYRLLLAFSSWAKSHFGKVTNFVRALLQGRNTSIDFQTFAKAAKGTGLRNCDLPHLFDALCKKRGCLNTADVAFLDSWDASRDERERHLWDQVLQKRFGSGFNARTSVCQYVPG